jgi:hypothetical protein
MFLKKRTNVPFHPPPPSPPPPPPMIIPRAWSGLTALCPSCGIIFTSPFVAGISVSGYLQKNYIYIIKLKQIKNQKSIKKNQKKKSNLMK